MRGWGETKRKAVLYSTRRCFGGTKVSLGRDAARAVQFIAYRLIQMGDRRDSVAASIEETGAI